MVTKPPLIDRRLSQGAAQVVKRFLIKNPSARLCCQNGIKELQTNPNTKWFSAVDFDDVINKRIKMPYIPTLNSETDTSSFEDVFTNERPVDSGTQDTSRKNGGKRNTLMKMLGMGSGSNNKGANTNEDVIPADAFANFTFVKKDEVSEAEAAKKD
jgi:hypothetical protein